VKPEEVIRALKGIGRPKSAACVEEMAARIETLEGFVDITVTASDAERAYVAKYMRPPGEPMPVGAGFYEVQVEQIWHSPQGTQTRWRPVVFTETGL